MGDIIARKESYQLIDRWMADSDLKQKTKTLYRKAVRYFMDWLEMKGIKDPTRADIIRYKEELQARGMSAYTISSYLVSVRRFFSWMEAERLYPDVARTVKVSKKVKTRREHLTSEQVQALLDSCERIWDPEMRLRERALIKLFVTTGIRTVEVQRANVRDISNIGEETVLWIQGKNHDSKDEYVKLEPSTLRDIRAYLDNRRATDSEPLFASLSDGNRGARLSMCTLGRIIREALKRAGLKNERICTHSLRHTAVTLALQAGVDVRHVQMMARHADISTTLIYAHDLERAAINPEKSIASYLGWS
jgi:site-specific recombinase XerD